MAKIWLFRIITFSLPLLFFVVLEFGLRLVGYGKSVPLFMANPAASQYLLPTPDVVKRYFADDSLAPNVTIETNFFLKQKPEDGIRVFVQGGSTAAGFPYGFGASIAGMLDYRLKQSFPSRPVEVVNTALSAVNSYTLLDFTDEIIEQQPDAVLIYAGHNEYLGILGVGSAYTAANSRGATLLYLKLKELRLFQLMQAIYHSFNQPNEKALKPSRTMMAKVARHKNIPVDSPLFQQGLLQFEQNMSLLLDKYSEAGIPVVLSTIASNLSHQAPFSSNPIPQEYRVLLAKPLVELVPSEANELLVVAEAYKSADAFYHLGQWYLSHGELGKAQQAFVEARQHDLLRFRAPSEINDIIRRLAKRSGVQLVDAEAALKREAPNNIIGNTLMMEHLHPTALGYFEIANSFYHHLNESQLLGQFEFEVGRELARQDIPLFAAEQYWGEAKIAGLKADYPFTSEPTKPELPKVESWSDQLGLAAYKKQKSWLDIALTSQQMAKKDKDWSTFIKASRLLADAMPDDFEYNLQAGTNLIQYKQAAQGIRYLKRATSLEPTSVNAKLALAHAYSQMQKLDATLEELRSVLKIEPRNQTALTNIKAIQAFQAKNKTKQN